MGKIKKKSIRQIKKLNKIKNPNLKQKEDILSGLESRRKKVEETKSKENVCLDPNCTTCTATPQSEVCIASIVEKKGPEYIEESVFNDKAFLGIWLASNVILGLFLMLAFESPPSPIDYFRTVWMNFAGFNIVGIIFGVMVGGLTEQTVLRKMKV